MTAQNPTAIFGLTNGDTTVRGSLGTFFCAPPVRSHLLADVTLERRNTSAAVETTYFRGNLVEWDSPASSVIARYTIPLLPDLEARVDLVDSHRQNHINTLTAQISFLYGTQLVDTYALTSTISPVTLRTTAVGAVRIEEGGVLTFRPATAQQRGQIRLKASFRSGESGNTDYDGTLADWPWIEGRADSCRGP